MANADGLKFEQPSESATYKTRRRPLTALQQAAMADLYSRFGLDNTGGPLKLGAVFGPQKAESQLVFEIGMGFGASLIAMAIAEPDRNVIGCEVHTPGVLATMQSLDAANIQNVRVVHGDAFEFLHRIPLASFDEVRLYFPDPWPKAGHRHRRMVTPQRIGRLVSSLRSGGRLHVVTDVDDYALQTQRVCSEHPELVGGRVERPCWRFETKFERKAQASGRSVVDLIFTRCLP